MASEKDTVVLKLELQEAQAKQRIKSLGKDLKKLDGRTKEYRLAVAKLNVENRRLIDTQKLLNSTTPILSKKMLQAKDATGSATSATMELSRVISDAPYGIRGMANNITQLVSQLGTASTKAGGFGAALKLMGKQLMGPLGIVFAITAVVSAMDYFFGANKKAEDSANKASESIGGQATKLLALKDALEDSSMSREEANEAVEAANKEFKELNLKLDENNKLTDDSVIAINNKIEALINLSKAQALQSLLEQKYSELLPLQAKQQDLDTEAKKANAKAMKQLNTLDKRFTAETQINNAARAESAAKENARAAKEIEKDIADLLKLGGEDGIIDLMFKGTKGRKGAEKKLSPFKTPKELDIDIKSAENAIIQYEKRTQDARLKEQFNERMSTAKTEEEKSKIRKNYQKDKLLNQIKAEKLALELKKKTELENVKMKTASHKADLKRIYDKYILELELNKKLSDEEKKALRKEATGKLGVATIQASVEEDVSIKEIEDKYTPLFSLFQKLSDARLSALFSMPSKDGKKKDESAKSDLVTGLENYMELQRGLTDFMNGEFSRQSTIEQNKTNALNNELNKRLLNENLSKEERKNIQLQIGANDEKLRIKQEQIEKKRFKLNKAANIAQATIATYLAGVRVLAETKGGTFARVAGMVATIGAGLANVAMISRQKFQSSAGSGGQIGGGFGGSSGGRGDRDFNFNLAGASNENQLMTSLQGVFDQPLQAYVVSRDISNAQQLQEDIAGNSSF
jgi:hypothetical protein